MSIHRLTKLARRIASSDAGDSSQQRELARELILLRALIPRESDPALESMLDTAVNLAEVVSDARGLCAEGALTLVTRLVTQMYFPNDPLFPFDPIFNSVPDEKARARMVSSFDLENTKPEWALCYRFDIVLRGKKATPMENS